MIESGVAFDFGQLVMDNEFARMIKHAVMGVPVDDELLGVDDIAEVGPFGDFLSLDSTLKFMRGQSQPKLIDRRVREDWAAGRRQGPAPARAGGGASHPRDARAGAAAGRRRARDPQDRGRGRRRRGARESAVHLKFDCLSAAEKDALHQRVLHVLEHVGIGVGSAVALGPSRRRGRARRQGAPHRDAAPGAGRALPGEGAGERAARRARRGARPARRRRLAAGLLHRRHGDDGLRRRDRRGA